MRLLLLFVSSIVVMASKNGQDDADDYSDFDSKTVQNGGANHELKLVTYSTIQPKFDIPTRPPKLLEPEATPRPIAKDTSTAGPIKAVTVQYRRGYFFQHYPWDRLPRQYLLRPGMTYVYPPQYTFYPQYRYPYLPYSDPYNIYRSHPGIGGGCGGAAGSGCGCAGGGCGGASPPRQFIGDEDEDEDEDSEEDSGEAKINKKDPLEDLELEDLEKLSKSDDENGPKDGEAKKKKNEEEDLDLIDDDDDDGKKKKKKKQLFVKWA